MARFFVISAPSGAGKTTLRLRLQNIFPELAYSVSYTTRSPRLNEMDGRDYHFIDQGRFQDMITKDDFLEWAEVFGRYYGTGRSWVLERLNAGINVLADVDVEGARQIKSNYPEAVLIFILPPTMAELERRLKSRITETDDQLAVRLQRSAEEIQTAGSYDYLVVNDDLERAAFDLAGIIRAERCRMAVQRDFWLKFWGRTEFARE
ncbi:MAG: guanylate kinase [Deltaproteobacteria bacterium]|nr:guanylate kinase [Deltaproteobacteria bacterium]